MPDLPAPVKRIIDRQIRAAGDTGNGGYSLPLKQFDDNTSPAHGVHVISSFDCSVFQVGEIGRTKKNPRRLAPTGV
jgi:hypothetical protein